MVIKSLFIFLGGILNIILGSIILKKNFQSRSNLFYFLLCLFGGLWGIVKAVQLLVIDVYFHNLIITRLVYIFGTLAPLAYLMFAYHYPYKLKEFSKNLISLLYFISGIFILLIFFGIFKMQTVVIMYNKVHLYVIFNNFLIFTIYFFVYIFFGVALLIKKFFRDQGIYKTQLKYLIIATISTFLIIGFVCIIYPLLVDFRYDWLGAIFLLIHFSVAGFLIFIKNR